MKLDTADIRKHKVDGEEEQDCNGFRRKDTQDAAPGSARTLHMAGALAVCLYGFCV